MATFFDTIDKLKTWYHAYMHADTSLEKEEMAQKVIQFVGEPEAFAERIKESVSDEVSELSEIINKEIPTFEEVWDSFGVTASTDVYDHWYWAMEDLIETFTDNHELFFYSDELQRYVLSEDFNERKDGIFEWLDRLIQAPLRAITNNIQSVDQEKAQEIIGESMDEIVEILKDQHHTLEVLVQNVESDAEQLAKDIDRWSAKYLDKFSEETYEE